METVHSSNWREKRAIVTGASRGIGRATAIRLAQDFGGVVLVARTASGLEEAAAAVRAHGAEALPLALDLREAVNAETVVARTLAQFGRIDAVVNIAGAVPQADLFTATEEDWAEGMSLKFHGARRLTLGAWESLRATQGAVVFTSGNTAIAPRAGLAVVSTINAAISALAKTFAERGLVEGVQVNSVLPGAVMTGRRRSMLEKYAAAHHLRFEEAVAQFAQESGIARYGTPEDIAALIAFLVSPAAHWMTGTTLRLDGGEIKTV